MEGGSCAEGTLAAVKRRGIMVWDVSFLGTLGSFKLDLSDCHFVDGLVVVGRRFLSK